MSWAIVFADDHTWGARGVARQCWPEAVDGVDFIFLESSYPSVQYAMGGLRRDVVGVWSVSSLGNENTFVLGKTDYSNAAGLTGYTKEEVLAVLPYGWVEEYQQVQETKYFSAGMRPANSLLRVYPHHDNTYARVESPAAMRFDSYVGAAQPKYVQVVNFSVNDFARHEVVWGQTSGCRLSRVTVTDRENGRLWALIDSEYPAMVIGEVLLGETSGATCEVAAAGNLTDYFHENNIPDKSFGPGLEFCGADYYESAAAPRTAAMYGKLLSDNPGWNYFDARAAIRQSCSFYGVGGWREDGGYGVFNWEIAWSKTLDDLVVFGPVEVKIVDGFYVSFFDWASSKFLKTKVVAFADEPSPGTLSSAGVTVYEGAGVVYPGGGFETNRFLFSMPVFGEYWLGFYSVNIDGGESFLEPFDIYLITYSELAPVGSVVAEILQRGKIFSKSTSGVRIVSSPGRYKVFEGK
jgi:hypothetical protein